MGTKGTALDDALTTVHHQVRSPSYLINTYVYDDLRFDEKSNAAT
jgi:hypothetical protein